MTTLQTVRLPRASRRPSITSIAIVGALHIGAIYALYVGLTHHWISIPQPGPLTVTPVPTPKHTDPLPPPPTGSDVFIKPVGPVVDRPVIDTVTDDHVGPQTGPTPPVGPINPVVVGPRGIVATHTIPNYPPLDVRLGHTGEVMLRLSIDEQGIVTAASVVRSSGYDTLDDAAVRWVVARWRYQPATRDGKPMASSTDAVVTFRLTSG